MVDCSPSCSSGVPKHPGFTSEDGTEGVDSDGESDRPSLNPGDVVSSWNGDHCYVIHELIGEGRCCVVYSGSPLRESPKSGVQVALKFYKRGSNYDGAFQREQFILDRFKSDGRDPLKYKIVTCYGVFTFKGLRVQILELLESNVRQIIYRNERVGLSPWATQKFARDLLT